MIELKKIAETIENGLNDILTSVTGNSEMEFHIWATAGKHRTAHREGNTVTYFINGNLRVTTSANDANTIEMGTNGLMLEFLIPIQMPRTNGKQDEEELQAIRNGQYPFPEMITSIINAYFKEQKTFHDDNFAYSFVAGTATPGTLDLRSEVGEAVPVSVYIELYYIEGGTMSKDIVITFDGKEIPYQSASFGRSGVIDRDIDVRDLTSKGTASSTAFSIELRFPSNKDAVSRAAVDYLLNGEPNTAHFVSVKWGDIDEKIFLMMIDRMDGNSEGITIAGNRISLIEAMDNCEILSFPDEYQVTQFRFTSSTVTEFSFSLNEDCNTYIAGKAEKSCVGVKTITLQPNDFEYDEDTDSYIVYLITDKKVIATAVVSEED